MFSFTRAQRVLSYHLIYVPCTYYSTLLLCRAKSEPIDRLSTLDVRSEAGKIKNKDKLYILKLQIYIYIHMCLWCVPNVRRSAHASKNAKGYGDQTSKLPKWFLEVAFAKSSFLNIFKKFLHTPFLPSFDTQHLICKKIYFVRRGGPKGSQKKILYLKILSQKCCARG